MSLPFLFHMQVDLPPGTVILAGPTASGKSAAAIDLARRINGEIVGADAFQVYRGLDILSAKPDAEMLRQVPHHLIGEVPLNEHFDVACYLKRAGECLAEIVRRGKTPIFCGGTGLYLRSLTHGLADLPTADEALREEFSKQPLADLIVRLRTLDPAGADTIDTNNPRRVIRALEVCVSTGKPFSTFRSEWQGSGSGVHAFVLARGRDSLSERINSRCEHMFSQGVVEEVEGTREVGRTAGQMLGLGEIRGMLCGKISRSECLAQIQQRTRNYAKRQLTWFRRETRYAWIDLVEESNPIEKIFEIVKGAPAPRV